MGSCVITSRQEAPLARATVWSRMLTALEVRGPLLRRSAGEGISGISASQLNEHFAVLYGAGLVRLQGRGRFLPADGWREIILVTPSPPDVDPEAWAALRVLTKDRRAKGRR